MVVGQQLAACLLYAAESLELWRLDASGFAGAAKQGAVVLVAGGTLLGLIIAAFEAARRMAEARARTGRARTLLGASQFYAALALPAFYWLGSALFSGGWISKQWFAPMGPLLITIIGAGAFMIGLRLIAYVAMRSAIAAAAGLALISGVLALLDRAVPKDLYLYLHAAFMLLSALALGGACRLLIEPAIASPRMRARIAGPACVVLALAAVLVFTHGPNVTHRLFWDRHPNYSGRLYEAVRAAAFRLRVGAMMDGAYREDVAVWSADQRALPSPDASHKAWRARIVEAQSAATRGRRPFSDDVKPHLLMVTVDALRADVANEAFERGVLAPLAQRGVVFRRAYSASASTRSSLPVLLSGRWDWRQHEQNILGALAADGYETAFVTEAAAAGWLKSQDQLWLKQPGTTLLAKRSAGGWTSESITQLAEQRLAQHDASKPLFLWVHYFDLHEWLKLDHAVHGGEYQASYRRVWSRVQAQVAALVQAAEAKLGAERLAIVIASDHGEFIGEMNRTHHTKWVAPELVRVPLVVVAPGLSPREALDPVGLIDVAPTLALLAGVSLPGAEGIPLLDTVTVDLARRPLVMGDELELGVVLGDHRLVLDPRRNILRMYNDAEGGQELRGPAHALQTELLGLLLGSPVARQ